ncbi:ABC transporter permease [uncultured Sphaerochaeta sp.]|uniref:ABC transporter permease n=1 Tax=uncultured Sphaerochaeta sp. TaxID=886478 RepID=UPI0037478EE2
MTGKKFFRTPQFVALIWLCAIVILWESSAFMIADVLQDKMAAIKLPYLHTVLLTIAKNFPMLIHACAITASRAVLGFLLGTLIGFLLAILMSLFVSVEKMLYPYLLLSQMVPVLGLAPVVISIVRKAKIGPFVIPASDITRVIIAAYITFFPVATNMLAGLKSVDSDKKKLMFSYAANKATVYRKLMLPFSLPYLFSGMKISAPLAVTASILVDSLGAAEGIGYNLTYALYTGSYQIFWASVVFSAAMGILSYYLVVVLERVCLPWKPVQKGNGRKNS